MIDERPLPDAVAHRYLDRLGIEVAPGDVDFELLTRLQRAHLERVVYETLDMVLGRPPGIKAGSSQNAPFVWTFAGLVLDAGGYEWKLTIGGDPVGSRPFTVAHPPGYTAE